VNLPFIPPQDLSSYIGFFQQANPNFSSHPPTITAIAARDVFLRSNLPQDLLARVWGMVNISQPNALTLAEFCVAMFMITSSLQGKEMPAVLPDPIRNQVLIANQEHRAVNEAPLSYQNAQPSAYTPVIQQPQLPPPSNIYAPSSNISIPAYNLQPASVPAPIPPSGVASLPTPHIPDQVKSQPVQLTESIPWRITPQEKYGFDELFRIWDPHNTKKLTGNI
jgi:hypothetical protein